jgi:uroporphyrinogen-III decarboxylase
MHARRLEEYRLIARLSPAEVVIPVENTSSTMISPALYERYSVPQLRDYVDALHAGGKRCVLHMCGHLKALMPGIRKTGLDGANAVTPPTVGDVTFDEVLDFFGEDFLIFGATFDPTIFQRTSISAEEMSHALDDLFTPRLRRARLVLSLPADGLPTPLDRFLMVRDWMLADSA